MPKATLTFNLPEERHEYKTATKAGDLSLIIYEFTNDLRMKAKHEEKPPADWQEVKDLWWSYLADYSHDPYED